MLGAITGLLACQLAGEVLVRLSGVPVPGPVAGMALLFVVLLVRGGVPEGLERVTRGLLGHLALLFVPASVGVMVHLGTIGHEALPILGALVGGTAVTMVVTGWVMQGLSRRARTRKEG